MFLETNTWKLNKTVFSSKDGKYLCVQSPNSSFSFKLCCLAKPQKPWRSLCHGSVKSATALRVRLIAPTPSEAKPPFGLTQWTLSLLVGKWWGCCQWRRCISKECMLIYALCQQDCFFSKIEIQLWVCGDSGCMWSCTDLVRLLNPSHEIIHWCCVGNSIGMLMDKGWSFAHKFPYFSLHLVLQSTWQCKGNIPASSTLIPNCSLAFWSETPQKAHEPARSRT